MHDPVSFPDWKSELQRSAFGDAAKHIFAREIIGFLRHCKNRRAPATAQLAKAYIEAREQQTRAPVRDALRWWFRAAKAAAAPGRSPEDSSPALSLTRDVGRPVPPPAAQDLGASPWERELIRAARERGFLWRTEPRKSFATRLIASA